MNAPENARLAVFVNTSDAFDDCWAPFFTLYERYAGSLMSLPLYLNTERKGYSWPGIDLHTTSVWPRAEDARPSWSECLKRGLEAVDQPYILYLQEDYFLTRPVDVEVLSLAFDTLTTTDDAGVVYLNRYGPQFRRFRDVGNEVVQILPPAPYLVSTQAALWRREFLLSLVRTWENGWMFEKFGTWRAARERQRFLSVRPDVMQQRPVVDYVFTGIIKGQWKDDCVEHFGRHMIDVDFSRRGIYRDGGRVKSRWEVIKKMAAQPGQTLRSIASLFQF